MKQAGPSIKMLRNMAQVHMSRSAGGAGPGHDVEMRLAASLNEAAQLLTEAYCRRECRDVEYEHVASEGAADERLRTESIGVEAWIEKVGDDYHVIDILVAHDDEAVCLKIIEQVQDDAEDWYSTGKVVSLVDALKD